MKTDQEIADKARERARRQNQAAKNNWDCVSCRLPKGTKERIQAQGLAVNGFINAAVLKELDRLEASATAAAVAEPKKTDPNECPF